MSVELEVAADWTAIFDIFSCKIFHASALVKIYHADCISCNKNKLWTKDVSRRALLILHTVLSSRVALGPAILPYS